MSHQSLKTPVKSILLHNTKSTNNTTLSKSYFLSSKSHQNFHTYLQFKKRIYKHSNQQPITNKKYSKNEKEITL